MTLNMEQKDSLQGFPGHVRTARTQPCSVAEDGK
jgi:hypothetical protein